MHDIVAKKKEETKHRWETAIKDANFDCIRNLSVCETRPEHFDRALADGKVSSNVYLRRIHNHALGHNSKAVHHAYAKHAEVTVPSLDEWEKGWNQKRKAERGNAEIQRPDDGGQKSEMEMPKPKVVQVDFRAAAGATRDSGAEGAAMAMAQGN